MQLSPQRISAEITQEIDKRILGDSPTTHDIDYYHRKITRLENECSNIHDELSKAKIKIKRSEDYQIKLDILLKQNTNLTFELEKKQKQINQLRTNNQYFINKLGERENKGEDWSQQRKFLQDEIDKWKTKAEDVEERRVNDIREIKQKSDELCKKQRELIHKELQQKQDNYLFQIRQLKKTVHQKQTVQSNISNKVSKLRDEKNQQISRLQKIIRNQKQLNNQVILQKNDQYNKMRQKFQININYEIEKIKKYQQKQDQLFNLELDDLKKIINKKNQTIYNFYQEHKKMFIIHQQQRDQLFKQIQLLKNKIQAIQRQNQSQLVNLKQRLTKIHSLQLQTLQKRYTQITKTLKNDNEQLQNLLKQKQRQKDAQKRQLQRQKQQLVDILKEKQAKIVQLQEKLQDTGNLSANQIKNLHTSFHKIQTEKQKIITDSQSNKKFLTFQIDKLTHSNQLKNNEIKLLNQQISINKNKYSQIIKNLQLRWKQERKDRQDQIEKQRNKKQNLQQQFRIQQQQWRSKQRQLQRQKQKQQRQKNKLKYICQDLQRDIERLTQYNKQLDQNFRKQLKKNQVNTLDTGGIRRQLTAQLERQKNQLETLKRMQIDQVKKRYEMEITKLTNNNQKLQTDLLNKSILYQNLQGQFKKLEHINKNIDRINKQKLIEYQKKMATLNNQISITQNLYQCFIEAKSRTSHIKKNIS